MRANILVIRELDSKKDTPRVEELERGCEAGSSGEMSLFTDLLGDPICRIRNSPSFLMLVAEMGKEIVGIIRGCIKVVSCGKNITRPSNEDSDLKFKPICTKLAYILGLRVSASHRRKGIGLKLVNRMEEWFRRNGAEYSYMATELDNKASLNLFTQKCYYTKFRTPSILVQPVFAHRVKTHRNRVTIIELTPPEAETLYRRQFSATEFFPQDIDTIVENKLNVGTFLAVPTEFLWTGLERFLSKPPESWAVLSAWNCKEVFTLEIKGASLARRLAAGATRMVDRALPWLRIPSVPNIFRPFGLLFLYGLGGQGPRADKLAKVLCGHAHNVARELGCGVVVTEVANQEPLRLAVPHWKRLSCAEDVWCIKRLVEDYSDGSLGDWTKSPPGLSIFVDPREF
ncbi:putative transcription regulator GNAT family [Rosa chinensis]|uniref:Putative transcription regulator GNAT family n=2 Tax=Rosa chinensis TaxID=74649 RepID=A0A2P6PLD9_ROSCH|nr:putative transcription regulator GNAT family [Rosa chinensis]